MDVSLSKRVLKFMAFGAFIAVAGPVLANPCPPGDPPTNCAPPTGDVIFDLAGSAIPHGGYTEYTTTFVASSSTTELAFAFREDPSYWEFSNVSVTSTVGPPGPNLVADGDFASTSLAPWNFTNAYGVVVATGALTNSCPLVGGSCWYDGSVQGYDGLNQSISTIAGHEYTLSFDLNDLGGLTTAQQLSTNGDISGPGGNGADVLAYAGTGVPVEGGSAPEIDPASLPSALCLLLGGLAVLRARKYGVALSQNAPAGV
jgi:hypothetical protein